MYASIVSIPVIVPVFSKDLPSIPLLAIVDHLYILAVVVMGIISGVPWSVAINALYKVSIINFSIYILQIKN